MALHTANHRIPLMRLLDLAIGGTVLRWMRSLLIDSSLKVRLGIVRACGPWPLNYGVPQGSIVSPMLLNTYTELLGEVVRGFGLCCHTSSQVTI